MTSERQAAANRRNAKRSSGPKSVGGKARSRQNAFRHGLSIAVKTIPVFRKDILLLARALSPDAEDISDTALNAAEAEIDLLRIRKYRAALIDASYDQGELIVIDLVKAINVLERYEKRAFAKRNKALRAIED